MLFSKRKVNKHCVEKRQKLSLNNEFGPARRFGMTSTGPQVKPILGSMK